MPLWQTLETTPSVISVAIFILIPLFAAGSSIFHSDGLFPGGFVAVLAILTIYIIFTLCLYVAISCGSGFNRSFFNCTINVSWRDF